MNAEELAAIRERDAKLGKFGDEPSAAKDRRALLAHIDALAATVEGRHTEVCLCPFDGSDPDCNLVLTGAELGRLVALDDAIDAAEPSHD